MTDRGPHTPAGTPVLERWALQKGTRHATCRIVPHPLGVEVVVEVDHELMLTQVHRQEADADIHAATLEDQFREKGWG